MKKKALSKKPQDDLTPQKRLLYVLFALVGLIVMYLIFVYPRTLPSETAVQTQTLEEAHVLEGLARFLDVRVHVTNYTYDDWTEESGLRVPLSSKQILLGTSDIGENVGRYGSLLSDQLDQVTADFLTPLQNKITEYFESNGFVQNEANTSLVPNDLYFSTVAFQKNNIRCLSHLSQMSDPFAYITCGTFDTHQLELQKELSNVLNEQQSQNWGDIPLTFRVNKLDGDFANGSIASLGGYQWIAKKIDGVFTTVWSGQDYPLCLDMAEHEVPASMYPGCYNPETQEVQNTY